MQIEKIHPKVFLDISLDSKPVGRVVFELYDDLAPKAVENFIQLIKGVEINGQETSYKGTYFHRVIKNFMVQGGDVEHGKDPNDPEIGKGGVSIFNEGGSFEDENLVEFDSIFNLAMANSGINSNKSQFFINTYPSPHLDGKHTIFGKVIHGKSTIRTIEYSKVDDNSKPLGKVRIDDCGIWEEVEKKDVPVYNASYDTIGGDIYEEYPDDDENNFDKENSEESLKVCEIIKESGTLLYKSKDLKGALFKYKKSLRYVNELIPDRDSSIELNDKFESLKRKLFLNIALVSNSLKEFEQSIVYSTYLLESNDLLDSEKAKGFYRRGVAYSELKKYKESLQDFQNSQKLNPTDKVIESKITSVEALIQQQKDKEKLKYAKFFGE